MQHYQNILAICFYSPTSFFSHDFFHWNFLYCTIWTLWYVKTCFPNENSNEDYHGYLIYIFLTWIMENTCVILQLLRKKMICQQLLTSSIPLCDESTQTSIELESYMQERGFLIVIREEWEELDMRKVNKINKNEGFDAIKTK